MTVKMCSGTHVNYTKKIGMTENCEVKQPKTTTRLLQQQCMSDDEREEVNGKIIEDDGH